MKKLASGAKLRHSSSCRTTKARQTWVSGSCQRWATELLVQDWVPKVKALLHLCSLYLWTVTRAWDSSSHLPCLIEDLSCDAGPRHHAESVVHQHGEADPNPLLAFARSPLCRVPSRDPGHDHQDPLPAMEVDTSANLPNTRLTLVIELFRTSANDMPTCIFLRSSAEQAPAGWTAFLITSHLT